MLKSKHFLNFLNFRRTIPILKEFEWFEWFEWFGPSPIEPFNSVKDYVPGSGEVREQVADLLVEDPLREDVLPRRDALDPGGCLAQALSRASEKRRRGFCVEVVQIRACLQLAEHVHAELLDRIHAGPHDEELGQSHRLQQRLAEVEQRAEKLLREPASANL